jgi:hypothetical protein
MTFKHFRFGLGITYLIVLGILLLSACGSSDTDDDSVADAGALHFNVVYHGTASDLQFQMAVLDCEGEGVETVEAAVYDSSDAFLIAGGPWDCDDGTGTIKAVPAGSNRTVVILAKNSEGGVVFRGHRSQIQIHADSDNDAGIIDCYTFAPDLRAPADGAIVNAGTMGLAWHALTGATEYRIFVFENNDLDTPIIDRTTKGTNFTPTGLSDDQSYFWQIAAYDSLGNQGIGSQVRSFTNDADHINTAPVVHIDSPVHGSTYLIHDEVVLSGSAGDAEEGSLSSASLEWSSDMDGSIGQGDIVSLSSLSPGTHRITLSAMDSEGAEGTQTVAATVATGRLPDTGQDTSHTETPGEDSDYDINPLSYTKLDAAGNDLDFDTTDWVMVRDNVTGLIWEVKTIGDENDMHYNDNRYSWHDIQGEFIRQLKVDIFGGYNDWRLPTVKELFTLVKNGSSDQNPEIDTEYFPNAMNSVYWSSTSYVSIADRAWRVNFYSGKSNTYIKSSTYFVRAVRGTSSIGNLVDKNDGTVTDTATGLMWQQFEVEDEVPRTTWEDALTLCESLNHAGYSDWRLPNVKELQSIVDHNAHDPAIDTTLFPNTESFGYWSSTSTSTFTALGVDFIYGLVDSYSKTGDNALYYVRAVRGGIRASE